MFSYVPVRQFARPHISSCIALLRPIKASCLNDFRNQPGISSVTLPVTSSKNLWKNPSSAEREQRGGTDMITEETMITMGGLAKKAVSTGMAAAFATMLALALAPSEAAAGTCTLAIPTCGCTISSPGNYVLTGASPMHSTGTCVDITASKVTLAGGAVIQGPGPTTATVGIHIEPPLTKLFWRGLRLRTLARESASMVPMPQPSWL
jgi:hypothetical protein